MTENVSIKKFEIIFFSTDFNIRLIDDFNNPAEHWETKIRTQGGKKKMLLAKN